MRIDGLGALPLHGEIRGATKSPTQSEFDRMFGEAVRADETTATPVLDSQLPIGKILEKGLYEYTREQRMARLRSEIRQQVMAAWGVTDQSLAKLDASAREDLLQRIEDEVERLLQERLRKEREAAAQSNGDSASAINLL